MNTDSQSTLEKRSIVFETTLMCCFACIYFKDIVQSQQPFAGELLKTCIIYEGIFRQPHISIIQRVFFDMCRCYVVPVSKMVVENKYNFKELEAGFPRTLILMAFIYSFENLQANYRTNPCFRTIVNLEFRYFKTINYIKYIAHLVTVFPNMLLVNFFIANTIEGCGVLLVTVVEITAIKFVYQATLRNFKAYMLINCFTFVYLYFSPVVKVGGFEFNSFMSSDVYLTLSFIVLFYIASDQVQREFQEPDSYSIVTNKNFYKGVWLMRIFKTVLSIRNFKSFVKSISSQIKEFLFAEKSHSF